MKIIKTFLRICIYLSIIVVFNFIEILHVKIFAQTDEILRYKADVFSSEVVDGETIRKLIGNVVLYQKNDTLKSRIGTFLQEKNKFIFEGNVQFDDGIKKIISEKVIYDNNKKIFYFEEGINLIKGNKFLTADKGIYYRDEKRAYCEGNVQYRDSLQTFTCRRAEFFEKDENINAYENIVFNNPDENITIKGEEGKYFSKENKIEITKNPIMILKEDNKAMTITAEKFEFFNVKSNAVALNNVEILRDNLKAKCEIAEYIVESGEEKIVLKENPVIIQNKSDIKGKQIDLFLKNKNIYKLNVIDDASATMDADTSGVYNYKNKLWGKNIYIFLDENKIEKMIAERNAKSVYYIFENGESKGANKVIGEKITIYFDKENIKNVMVDGESEGVFYPKNVIKEITNQ